MKELIHKLDAYIKVVDLEEISDRRFCALLGLYTEMVRSQDLDEDNADIKAFIDAVESSIS